MYRLVGMYPCIDKANNQQHCFMTKQCFKLILSKFEKLGMCPVHLIVIFWIKIIYFTQTFLSNILLKEKVYSTYYIVVHLLDFCIKTLTKMLKTITPIFFQILKLFQSGANYRRHAADTMQRLKTQKSALERGIALITV